MTTASNDNGEGGNQPREPTFRLNPEALRGVPQLPDLDKVHLIHVRHAPTWARWTEGLMIHLVGSGLVAVLAFVLGLMIGSNVGG